VDGLLDAAGALLGAEVAVAAAGALQLDVCTTERSTIADRKIFLLFIRVLIEKRFNDSRLFTSILRLVFLIRIECLDHLWFY